MTTDDTPADQIRVTLTLIEWLRLLAVVAAAVSSVVWSISRQSERIEAISQQLQSASRERSELQREQLYLRQRLDRITP